jgi:glycosyltransferase involved in cell wall biosynthesis
VPEIVVDGETGFLVNYSNDFIRGDFIIKKTGVEGLIEAVERLKSMGSDDYQKMRQKCRKHVEEKFTVGKMVEGYERVYKSVVSSQ